MQEEDVGAILNGLRDYFQPDALDHVCQQLPTSLQEKRTDLTTERYQLEFDLVRLKAEARVLRGGASCQFRASRMRLSRGMKSSCC